MTSSNDELVEPFVSLANKAKQSLEIFFFFAAETPVDVGASDWISRSESLAFYGYRLVAVKSLLWERVQ